MMIRLKMISLYIIGLALITPSLVYADKKCTKTWDDFENGFSVSNQADGLPANKWFYFAAGPFIGNDGKPTIEGNTLTIQPLGNSDNHPAFTKYLAPEGVDNNPFGLPGGLDHVKWLTYMNHTSSTGYPGFTAPESGPLVCETQFKGQTYGTQAHPFGGLVPNANDDLRLAGSAMNVIDFQTYLVLDMFVSNEQVYAFYERLPFGRGTPGFSPNYAAFSYAIPVAKTDPKKTNELKVSYNKAKGEVTWFLNGKKVYQVARLGYRLENQTNPFHSKYSDAHPPILLLDHGGVEEDVLPTQLDCGMGLFTLLDGNYPNQQGLVQLSTQTPYVNLGFLKTTFDKKNYLWGQGASLSVRAYKVTSPDVCALSDIDDDNEDEDN